MDTAGYFGYNEIDFHLEFKIRILRFVGKCLIWFYFHLIPDESSEIQFINSLSGNPLLVDTAGYVYCKRGTYKNSTYWACVEFSKSTKCPAKATTNGVQITKFCHVHAHPPDERASNKYY